MKRVLFLIAVLLSFSLHGQVITHVGYSTVTNNLASYTTEYQAYYDAMTTPPDAGVASAQDDFFEYLTVTTTYWDSIDGMWFMAQNNSANALINARNPGFNDATDTSSTAFTALEGFTGNGTDDYINLNWNPTTDGTNYTLNSASVILYRRSVHTAATNISIGAGDRMYMYWNNGTSLLGRINDNGAGIAGSGNDNGVVAFVRRNSAERVFHNDGTEILHTYSSLAIPNIDSYVLAWNSAGTPSTFSEDQVSLVIFANGLSELAIEGITTAFETYMDSNGKGVIP